MEKIAKSWSIYILQIALKILPDLKMKTVLKPVDNERSGKKGSSALGGESYFCQKSNVENLPR